MTWQLGTFAASVLTAILTLTAVCAAVLLSDWRRPRP